MTSQQSPAPPIVPVILSGGAGTRLWPLSTPERPKQFLALTGERTMFAQTLDRVATPGFAAPIVVGNAAHAAIIEQQLTQSGHAAQCLVLEPCARNTAPAIALAALAAGGGGDLLLVMPSDHAIEDAAAFRVAVAAAAPAADAGRLVTFGVTPTGPATGYGYLETGPAADGGAARPVARFVEKPDEPTAKAMLASGNYLWNAGIFLFRADRYLDILDTFEPDMRAQVQRAFDRATRTDGRLAPDPDAFAAIAGESIDYAIMERAEGVTTVPLDCGWSDIGSWDALADIGLADRDGNVLNGRTIVRDARDCVVHADGVRVSLIGVADLIVVADGNEVLIVPRGQSQRVREAADAARADGG